MLPAPADTLYSFDPGLSALGPNGGPTPTMALSPTSIAVNAGNNTNNGKYDQRGAGFDRVIGANADIGAFETDVIFRDGFDG